MSQSAQNIVPGEKLNSNGVFMFELKDLTDDNDFNASDYRLNPVSFLRNTALPNGPMFTICAVLKHMSWKIFQVHIICPMNILKPPFIKCLLHEISCFMAEKTEKSLLQQKFSMTMALTRSVLQILLKHF